MAKPKQLPMTAKQVLELLARSHTRDVFVTECKTGSTWFGAPIRMDAWAMQRSWAHACFTGYEVKVTRADFLRDDKWPGYLRYCHAFYFVVPPGVIKPEECPEQAGLKVVASTGTRIFTKKKAPMREIDMAEAWPVLVYILMSRAVIGSNVWDGIDHGAKKHTRERNLVRWRAFLDSRKDSKELGREVGGKIAAMMADATNRLHLAERKEKAIADVDRILRESFGIGVDELTHEWRREERMRDALTMIPAALVRRVAGARDHLGYLLEELERFRKATLTDSPET